MAASETSGEVLTTVDGTPLKVSLRRALQRSRRTSLLLVAPLFLFIAVTFLAPIGDMLVRSVDNKVVDEILPNTVQALRNWDETTGELPGDEAFAAMVLDLRNGYKDKILGRVARRLNYELPGMSSLFRSAGRKARRITEAPFKEALIESDGKWANVEVWRLIKRESPRYTGAYFLSSVDMTLDSEGSVAWKPEDQRIYLNLFVRTLVLSFVITVLCILLGYPIAFLMATLPARISNLLMILVLLPFWTSLLVRTTSWIALLQTEGVLNDIMVGLGFLADDGRVQLIHNQTGTIVAMTHILLPFMVLPLYSVMKTISPEYMRAARSLGATQFTAFVRIYMPNTVPGIGAGSILVFILAIGYYITPALVGGQTGTFISNFIASFISGSTQNWGLAAALGSLLLLLVLALYLLYDKIVGIDNMKLG